MAEVPQGATLHYCSKLLLPVLSIENIFLFPGIPELFQQKLDAIKDRFRSAPYFSEEIHCTEMESTIASLLRKALRLYPKIKIGSYPRWGDEKYKVKIAVESKDQASVKKASTYLQTRLKGKSVRATHKQEEKH
jgi:FAD synthetase